MGNIYFIDRFPFNREFYNRNEFKKLKSLGYNVKFLELSRFLKRKILPNDIAEDIRDYIIKFESRKELDYFLKKQKADTLIVTTVPFVSSSAWMYYYMFKNNIPYVLEEHASIPSFHNETKLSKKKKDLLHQFKTINCKKIISKPFETFYFLKALVLLKPAHCHISSKVNTKTIFKRLSKKYTKRYYAASPDYKVAKKLKAVEDVNGNYAVFIDQYFYHHPDFKTKRITHSFSADEYYNEINQFLKDFEGATGLNIIIAAHPRRQFEHAEDFNSDFNVYYNKTASLIKNAKIVLLHFSTAISYATIFNKPVLLIDSDLFENSNIRKYIDNFKVLFGSNILNISHLNNTTWVKNELFEISLMKYKEFIKNYLKHPKSSNHSSSDIILEHFNEITNNYS